jgi:hypothetical protein
MWTCRVSSTIAKEAPIFRKEQVLIGEKHKDPVGLLKTEDIIRCFYKLALHCIHVFIPGIANL